jgi:tripartite-type tricarboxylate transporter receptor subunit TctC
VTSEDRNVALPDTPSLAESIHGFRVLTWFGLAVPAGTPQAVVDRLARESAAAVASPALRQQLLDMGLTPASSTPAQFAEWIRKELEHWSTVAKAANIKIE